jgi:hypothetical protein
LLAVVDVTFVAGSHILENRLDFPVLFFVKPDLVRVHIAVFIIILVVESHLPQNVFLFVTHRRELVIRVVLLEEAVSMLMTLQHRQDTRFQVV